MAVTISCHCICVSTILGLSSFNKWVCVWDFLRPLHLVFNKALKKNKMLSTVLNHASFYLCFLFFSFLSIEFSSLSVISTI